MIFLGPPKQMVYMLKRVGREKKRVFVGQFDEKGEFTTTDETIIAKMKNFQVKEEKIKTSKKG